MGKKDKLIKKLKSNPKDFTFAEAESLFNYLGYHRDNKGKTSGSRVRFANDNLQTGLTLHKPHPQKELRDYQINDIINYLEGEGLI